MNMCNSIAAVILISGLAVSGFVCAEESKVLSNSPNGKIEIYTKEYDPAQEEVRPWAKGGLLGKGIYARFIGEDTPDQTLWTADDTSFEVEIEWDASSTRLFVRQGDAKAWDDKFFVLRRDVRTNRLLLEEPRLPDLAYLLALHTTIPLSDRNANWSSADIVKWKDPEEFVLMVRLVDEFGKIQGKEGSNLSFYFFTSDLHQFTLTKIAYDGVLPSEWERWYEDVGTDSPYAGQVKTLYKRGEQGDADEPATAPELKHSDDLNLNPESKARRQ
jgi:hypothetical protein